MPYEPLHAIVSVEHPSTANDVSAFAKTCGVARPAIYQWRKHGVRIDQADRVAVALGKHPLEIWPEFHADLQEAE
jgi:hypothetical protein